MDKILIEVSCPATSKKYDFWISKKLPVVQAKQKLLQEISSYEKNDELFLNTENVILYMKESEKIIVEHGTIEQVGITSGTCILVI